MVRPSISCVNLANGAGIEDLDLEPESGSRRLHVFHRGLSTKVSRIYEDGHTRRPWH